MGRLEGKVALISGGARGQGAAEAQLFAQEGAGVVLSDVLDAEGEATAKACGGRYLHHDVTSAEDWARVVAAVLDRHGRLDILVNNAGIWMTGRLTDTSEADYRRVIDVNQVGVFLGMQAVAKPMIAARSGAIINISSIAGMRGAAGGFAYGASKWAVRGMTKSAAQELGRFGIRVNSIHPGLIETAMLHQLPGIDAGGLEERVRRIPLSRVGEAEDVARLALFLASDDSAYCSGAEFIIDGALTA
ncbi:MAG TPA: glucose 1-dehydrogenase [Dehalococcoidia bacterium]|jgi:3alpha(or 20beta)-hydroxysteroid dehydrogenase